MRGLILSFAALLTCGTASARAAQLADSPAAAHRDDRYRLCASDVISLTFPLTPEFDQTVSVQPDGFVSLAGASNVHLEGMTTEESAVAIRAAYAKILHDPIVTVELKDFNKPYFVVSGQVNRPGKYDLRGETSATQAIAIAGGFNDAARHSQVFLFRRINNDWYEANPRAYAITAALAWIARLSLHATRWEFTWACASALGALLALMLGLGGMRTDEAARLDKVQRVELDQRVF